MVKLKTKGKVHPLTGHEGPEEYCSSLSSTSVLDVSGWLMPRPDHFISRKEMSYPLYICWVGPRACMKGHGKSLALVGVQILNHPAHSQLPCWLHCPGPSLGMVANIWLTVGNWELTLGVQFTALLYQLSDPACVLMNFTWTSWKKSTG
jgi:hypothetical protein